MRRLIIMRRLLLTIGAISAVACGGDSSTGPGDMSAVGSFQLQTVNGSVLPYTAVSLPSPVFKLELLSDLVVIRSDGSYTQTFSTRQTQGTTVTTDAQAVSGTWTQSNGTVTFTPTGGSPSTLARGIVAGDVLTVTVTGAVFVYRRQ